MGDRQGEPIDLGLEATDEGRGGVGVLDGEPGDERVVGELGVVWSPHSGTTTQGRRRIARNPSRVVRP